MKPYGAPSQMGERPLEQKTCKACNTCLEANRSKEAKVRAQVLDHYGWECACCGDPQAEFLQIDHVDGGGSQHRKEIPSTYRWLIRNGFPDGFNTLCANCNVGKHINGGVCPSITHEGRYMTASSRVITETRAEAL